MNKQVGKNYYEDNELEDTNVDAEEATIKTATENVDEFNEVEDHRKTTFEPLPAVKDGSGYIQKGNHETKQPSKLPKSLGDENTPQETDNTEAKQYTENAASFNSKIFSRKILKGRR